MNEHPAISQVQNDARNTKQLIRSFEANIKNMDQKIKDFNIKVESANGSDEEGKSTPVTGSSKDLPGSGCQNILNKFPYKENGYFWIKTGCMSKAHRVYCDFTHNLPNFYVYKGL